MTARRARLIAAACALALARAARGDEPSDISVRVSLDRASARIHEQVLLSVEVTHPVDARASWEPPPFDGFWAERLSTRALPDAPNGLHRTQFRRALFPTRAGRLAIARSRLVLAAGEGDGERDVAVPGTALDVAPLPDGVPADVLVGRLELHLATSGDQVLLGKSLVLTLELAGEANVWDAPAPPLERLVGPDVELFPEPPRLSIGENAGRATTRRTFRYALVPARAGRLEIPPLEIPYFDPAAGALASARSEPLAFDVIDPGGAAPPRATAEPAPLPARRGESPLEPLALAAAAALAGAVAFVVLRRRRSRAPGAAQASPRDAFDAARNARGTRDFASLLAHAVRVGIGTHHRVDAQALTPGELAGKIDDREALELLAALDQVRFAGRPADEDALLERTRAYLRL